MRRWAGLGGTSGAVLVVSVPFDDRTFFFSTIPGAAFSTTRFGLLCSALSGIVPAMLSGLGFRGGGLGRITTDEDIWLEATECSDATDMDERGRDGDCCSLPTAAPTGVRLVALSCDARVGRGAIASWLMLRADRSLLLPVPPLPGSTMLWDMSTPRLEGGLPEDKFSMLLAAILGGVAAEAFVLGLAGSSRGRRGCASTSRRDMLTAR